MNMRQTKIVIESKFSIPEDSIDKILELLRETMPEYENLYIKESVVFRKT